MDRWDALRAIVELAAGRPATERRRILDERCGGDEGLRREAIEILDGGLADDGFLARADLEPPAVLSLGPGARVGPYRIVRPIAAGGMGAVYEAEQETPRRRVALKVMRTGVLAGASAARFRREVEVLAQLRHPCIAHVYETGVHVDKTGGFRRELPWFAMEYVEGARTILEFAREENLSADERLALFARVCEAVHHGHMKGVIHRDLKPDNILVDAEGRPRVIDFGIARADDATRATRGTMAGEILGTLEYMSPEQVAGEPGGVDVRSDVYSLGVVLFELLTGELPLSLHGRSLGSAIRIIRETPPPRAGRIRPALRGDRERILARCLAKDPADRYASAHALAADLERVLANRPIEARPPSLLYLAGRFARRHRLLVATGLLLFVVSVAAAAVSLTFLAKANRENRRSRELVELLLSRATESTFRFAPQVNQLPGGAPLSLEMVEGVIDDLESLEARAGDDPRVRLALGHAWLSVGDVQGNPSAPNLGDRDAGRRSYERARSFAEALLTARPDDPDALHLFARSERKLGEMAAWTGRLPEAKVHLDRAAELLDGLLRRRPAEVRYQVEAAWMWDRRGFIAGRSGKMEEFESSARRSLAIFEELRAAAPDEPGYRVQCAQSRQQLAALHWKREEYDKVISEHLAAREMLLDLARERPETVYRTKAAWSAMWAGSAEKARGRAVEAHALLDAARVEYEALLRDDPENAHFTPELVNLYWVLGTMAEDSAAGEPAAAGTPRLAAARDWYAKALALYEETAAAGRVLPSHTSMPDRIRKSLADCEARIAATR